jgi:hypothetical protein
MECDPRHASVEIVLRPEIHVNGGPARPVVGRSGRGVSALDFRNIIRRID